MFIQRRNEGQQRSAFLQVCITYHVNMDFVIGDSVLFVLNFYCVSQTVDEGEGQDKETAFVRNLQTSIRNRKPLRINRRGLVKLSEEAEKPAFSANELYRNRQ